jgi:hypothetical protein
LRSRPTLPLSPVGRGQGEGDLGHQISTPKSPHPTAKRSTSPQRGEEEQAEAPRRAIARVIEGCGAPNDRDAYCYGRPSDAPRDMLPPRCLLSFAFRGRSNAAGRDRPQAFQPRRGLPSGPRWSVTPAASAGIHSSSDEAQAPSGYPRAPPPAPHVRTVRTRYPSWSRDGGEFKGRARGGDKFARFQFVPEPELKAYQLTRMPALTGSSSPGGA